MDDNTYKRLSSIDKQLSDFIAKKLLQPEHFGLCGYCREEKNSVKMRRQNTLYEEEDANYIESCKECFEEKEEYWADMWAYYYGSRF
jgi:uncharacterized protein with PIN domain